MSWSICVWYMGKRARTSPAFSDTSPAKEIAMPQDTDDVHFQVQDRLATLTLNRPERLNALSDAMIDGAVARLREWATDPDVGAVLVTGAGRGFCAGGDVSAMRGGGERKTFESYVDRQHEMHELSWLLATIPKVTIAAVNGAAAGAGLGIALSCDLTFASDRARFTTAFAKVGFGGVHVGGVRFGLR
jgi:2-(1,2-epoxy-1,2-dihydrophenyl)acetyl-CoA isomerase